MSIQKIKESGLFERGKLEEDQLKHRGVVDWWLDKRSNASAVGRGILDKFVAMVQRGLDARQRMVELVEEWGEMTCRDKSHIGPLIWIGSESPTQAGGAWTCQGCGLVLSWAHWPWPEGHPPEDALPYLFGTWQGTHSTLAGIPLAGAPLEPNSGFIEVGITAPASTGGSSKFVAGVPCLIREPIND